MWSNQNVQISLGVDLTIKIVYGSKINPNFAKYQPDKVDLLVYCLYYPKYKLHLEFNFF